MIAKIFIHQIKLTNFENKNCIQILQQNRNNLSQNQYESFIHLFQDLIANLNDKNNQIDNVEWSSNPDDDEDDDIQHQYLNDDDDDIHNNNDNNLELERINLILNPNKNKKSDIIIPVSFCNRYRKVWQSKHPILNHDIHIWEPIVSKNEKIFGYLVTNSPNYPLNNPIITIKYKLYLQMYKIDNFLFTSNDQKQLTLKLQKSQKQQPSESSSNTPTADNNIDNINEPQSEYHIFCYPSKFEKIWSENSELNTVNKCGIFVRQFPKILIFHQWEIW